MEFLIITFIFYTFNYILSIYCERFLFYFDKKLAKYKKRRKIPPRKLNFFRRSILFISLFSARRAESALASFRVRKLARLLVNDGKIGRYDHLRYSLALFDFLRLFTVI